MKYLIAITAIFLLFGCNNPQAGTGQPSQSTPAVAAPLEFNKSDKSIMSNNNLAVAVSKLAKETPDGMLSLADPINISTITKSPYSLIGRICKITGRVYKIEELPPEAGRQGKWGEILLLVENPNSPLGATTIDYIYNGDISKINSGQVISCVGYFVGTYESENAMGGTVEAVSLVGNKILRK